jgi:hypothetical protein
VLNTCQPSTVWCSWERLPAAAAQPAKVRQSCSATDYYYIIISFISSSFRLEMPPSAFKDAIIRDVMSHDRAATVIDKLHIS